MKTQQSQAEFETKDIAVIGMSGRFPGADTIEELWEVLKEGRETISHFSDDELDPFIPAQQKNNPDYVKARGIINNAKSFDATFFNINSKLSELMDPQHRVFLELAWEALESTGYLPEFHDDVIGVFAGCDVNSYYVHNVLPNRDLVENIGGFQVMTANEKDYLATRIAYLLNLTGPAINVSSGCSTALLAITQAVENIRAGRCDLALAGGITITSPIKSGYIYKEGAMLSPDGHCRPFNDGPKGTVFSDGAGIVLLKSLKKAVLDGDTIYGIIKGIGVNNDGSGKSSFVAPSAFGQAGALRMAIVDAGVDPSTVSYIEAHGTGTSIGDPTEIQGLKLAYGSTAEKPYCRLSSVKSNLGHLTAAAGVAGFIKAILSLHHAQIPASINIDHPNKNLGLENSPFYVNDRLADWETNEIRRAGVSSFGVGGTNVHVVLEEYVNSPKAPSSSSPLNLFCWSAKTEESLDAYGRELIDHLQRHQETGLADAAYTLTTTRPNFNLRRFAIANSREDLQTSIIANNFPGSRRKQKDKVAFLFAGQGTQAMNMCQDLYQNEKVFRQAADECANLLQEVLGENILDIIYPKENDNNASNKLNLTNFAQPALFLVEYSLSQLWLSLGINPAYLSGHSIGEFVAAHLAGIFSLEDALKLVSARGRLMAQQSTGCMTAVRIEANKLEEILPAGISIAAINTPINTVISGPENDITLFEALLNGKGIQLKRLITSHAFHSEMMDPAVAPFKEMVESVILHPPSIPVISTVTGKVLTDDEALSPEYWARQLRKPVRFRDAVNTLSTEADLLFLEVGPGSSTAQMAVQNCVGKEIPTISSLNNGDIERTDRYKILEALGKLWVNGIQPDWNAFYDGQERQKVLLPTYRFNRKPCWVNPPAVQQSSDTIPMSSQQISQPYVPNNSAPSLQKERVIQRVSKILEDASGLDIQASDPNASFIELGLDSLLLTQITLTLKNEFKVPITYRNLNEGLHSLNRLTEYLVANMPEDVATSQTVPQASGLLLGGENTDLASLARQVQFLAQQISTMQASPTPPASFIPNQDLHPANTPSINLSLNPDEAAELKKPFGAIARIDKEAMQLTAKQQSFIDELTIKYTKKTLKSKAYTQEHRKHMADPRAVTGFRPKTKELVYPIVVDKSSGSRLWDIDGNEYIDAINGFGSNMFGHQNPIIKKAIQAQLDEGYEIGPQHALAGDVCKLLCEFTGFDRSALCNTGSEAVLGAMRIARTVTGRSIIVAFSGSYHGITDEVLVRGTKRLKSFPAASGIMPQAVENMLILDYGTEETLQIIRERGHEFAAVLVEPVQSRRPDFHPIEFLKQLREITTAAGSILIFDEVITGFRTHPGGTQALFNIKADLATYGKAIGGGLPIGVIAGAEEYMDALDGGFWQYGDDSVPEAGVTYFAGTFVRHPLALAAAKAALQYMKEQGPDLQERLNEQTQYMANEINLICKKHNLPLYLAHFGSLWKLKYKDELPYGELIFTLMRLNGIHVWDNFPCFLSVAHAREEVDTIISVFEKSALELARADFFPEVKIEDQVQQNNPLPPPGARLGKDKDGNPAWFIADPEQLGRFIKVEVF